MKASWLVILLLSISVTFAAEPATDTTVHLTGREAEAMVIAAADFKQKHYSASRELSHYSIEIERHDKEIEITFLPDEPRPLRENEAGTGSGTAYGLCVTYVMSLSPPKIIRFYFAR
jgi:hypothetical protein